MTGNRRPTRPDERINPENPDARPEDEEEEEDAEDAGENSDENNTDTSTGSSGTPGTPPDSPLTNEIRRVRAANQQLESQLAGYGPQIAAAKSMQLQFTEAVDTIQACMNNIKQNMTSIQRAQFSSWAENRMSEITQEPLVHMEPGAGTSTGSETRYDFERDEEEFRIIKNRFDKLKRLIAIREQAEAGGSVEFSESSRNEIAELACRGGNSDTRTGGGVAAGSAGIVPGEGAAENAENVTVEDRSPETCIPGEKCRDEEAENDDGN